MTEPSLDHRQFIWRVSITILIIVLVGLALFLMLNTIDIIFVVFAGILLAITLRGISDWVSDKTRLPESWSLTVVIVGIATTFGVAGWIFFPQLATQISNLSDSIPEAVAALQARAERYDWLEEFVAGVPSLQNLFNRINILSRTSKFFSTTAGLITNIFVMLFIGIYLAVNPSVYKEGMVALFPSERRDAVRQLLNELRHTLLHWLVGRGIGMIVIAILSTVGLVLLNVPMALTLGLFSGLICFIPYIGPILSMLLPALLVVPQGLTAVLSVVALYIFIQFVESYFITPYIQERAVSVPPALTISSQLFLGVLTGVLGVIFATPLMATILVLVKRLYIDGVLHEQA